MDLSVTPINCALNSTAKSLSGALIFRGTNFWQNICAFETSQFASSKPSLDIMSFNAWPDQGLQGDKFVGPEVVQRPTFLEPLVPPREASSVHSASSLSRALSAAIESQNRLLGESSHASSDELMRATIEARDAMSSVKDSLDVMPPDAIIDEPMIRQRFPLVPTRSPELLQ